MRVTEIACRRELECERRDAENTQAAGVRDGAHADGSTSGEETAQKTRGGQEDRNVGALGEDRT